jgi:hypothetical protein
MRFGRSYLRKAQFTAGGCAPRAKTALFAAAKETQVREKRRRRLFSNRA